MPGNTRRSPFVATVHPTIGIGSIRFGASATGVIAILGDPAEGRVDGDGDQILSYPDIGIPLLAFDRDEGMRLVSYELSPKSEAELWGLKVFGATRLEVAQTAAAQGLLFTQIAEDHGEETLFQIRSQSLDFYYECGRLVALSAGVGLSACDILEWPASAP